MVSYFRIKWSKETYLMAFDMSSESHPQGFAGLKHDIAVSAYNSTIEDSSRSRELCEWLSEVLQ